MMAPAKAPVPLADCEETVGGITFYMTDVDCTGW